MMMTKTPPGRFSFARPVKPIYYSYVLLMYVSLTTRPTSTWVPDTVIRIKGAIGFDRMAAVVVACAGRSLGLLNHVSKHQLPITVMSAAASASAPRSQWLPKTRQPRYGVNARETSAEKTELA